MALKFEKIERVFVIDKKGQEQELPDPNSEFTPEQVLNFYSTTYPELNNSVVKEVQELEGKIRVSFSSNVGTKG